MNLQNLNLVELNAQEVQDVEGGNLWRTLGKIADAVGIAAAIDDFEAGWNSVERTGFRPGGGSGGSW
jgi:hypothetical protein